MWRPLLWLMTTRPTSADGRYLRPLRSWCLLKDRRRCGQRYDGCLERSGARIARAKPLVQRRRQCADVDRTEWLLPIGDAADSVQARLFGAAEAAIPNVARPTESSTAASSQSSPTTLSSGRPPLCVRRRLSALHTRRRARSSGESDRLHVREPRHPRAKAEPEGSGWHRDLTR